VAGAHSTNQRSGRTLSRSVSRGAAQCGKGQAAPRGECLEHLRALAQRSELDDVGLQ